MLPSRLLPFAAVLLLAACEAATPDHSVAVALRSEIRQLPGGDSVELQATGPAVVRNGSPGHLITYFPFRPFADTAGLEALALVVMREVQGELPSPLPPFVVLRAVDRRATDRQGGWGTYEQRSYGVVFRRNAQGQWYRKRDSTVVSGL